LEEDEEEVPRWHTSTFLSNLAVNRDSTVGFEVVKIEEDFGEEFVGVKDIYKDGLVLDYL